MAPPASKLFTPFKAIGLVTSDKALSIRYNGCLNKYQLKVPVGNTFHTYGAGNLSLDYISDFHKSTITCVASGSKRTDYTGTQDGTIYQWNLFSDKLIQTFKGHSAEIKILVPVGDHLVSVDVDNNFKVWNTVEGNLYLETTITPSLFEISVACHPHTYLNKIVFGSRQGSLRLFNFRTSKLLYTFNGWGSGVTAIESPKVLDIVAIGLQDGRIVMHNLKSDETVFTLKQDWGMVSALSFRTDNHRTLLSGSMTGHISVWDLEEQQLKSTIQDAHNGPIISLICAEGDPIAFTTSTDNVIKSWVFDMPDGGGRSYITRSGHSEPPLKVRFHGSSGKYILSGGLDSNLRCSDMVSMKGKTLGLACYNRRKVKKNGLKVAQKMPPIINFTTELSREEAWDNVAALHLNCRSVSTWSYYLKKCHEELLSHKRFGKLKYENVVATCIDISACGNYVLVGYSSGHLERFNIQSKLHQLSYTKQDTSISGIVTDALNLWVVLGLQDGYLHWLSFRKGELHHSLKLSAGVQNMCINRDSGLCASSLDDWSIVVADVDTRSIVRKLYGHYNKVTDMAFTSDSKWLVTSSMDHSIRTWDIPTGTCVDHFAVPTPATSLAMSPLDDYLVTTHVDELGLYVWANRTCLTFVSLQPIKPNYTPQVINLPSSSPDLESLDDNDDKEQDAEDMEDVENVDYKSPEQISQDCVTIDVMPTSRWLNLLKIDDIKARSRPTEAPKVLKSAPFFLQAADDGEVNGNVESENLETENTSQSKIKDVSINLLESLSPFGKLLKESQYDAAFEILSKKGPTNVDNEIRNLDPDLGGSRLVMLEFLNMVLHFLEKRTHFELIQGYFGLFMKRHPDFLSSSDADLRTVSENISAALKESWQTLEYDLNMSMCLLEYFKNSAVSIF